MTLTRWHPPAPPPSPPVVVLTPRQMDVLWAISLGLTNGQIARRLGIAEDSVRNHVKAVLSRMGARSRTEAAVMARSGHVHVHVKE